MNIYPLASAFLQEFLLLLPQSAARGWGEAGGGQLLFISNPPILEGEQTLFP